MFVVISAFVLLSILICLYYEQRKSKLLAENKRIKALYPYPVAFHTVDMACIRETATGYEVVLGQKKLELGSELWRFPGGFVDPIKDNSAEEAAIRELEEEVPGVETSDPKYVFSMKTNDTRYRGREDKIITSFFIMNYLHGEIKPGDDLAAVKWIDINVNSITSVNPIHKKLFTTLIKECQAIKQQKELSKIK